MEARAAGSNEEVIFETLTNDLGFNVAAACGILANIKCESNFYPGALSGAGSYGLCQWTGGRRYALYDWCDSNGYDSDSINGQLHFLQHELSANYNSVYNYLMNVENSSEGAYDAGWYWCYHFERPANRSGRSDQRGRMAAGTYWNRYSIYLTDRWMETAEGTKYMHKGGTYHTGWMTMDGDDYYFDGDGILKTGWFKADGSTYFSDENGAKVTGWYTVDDSTYYFGLDGSLQKGWITADGGTFYLDQNGRLKDVAVAEDGTTISDTAIANAAAAKENAPDKSLTAPAADPVPIDGTISGAVNGMCDAAEAGTQSNMLADGMGSPTVEENAQTASGGAQEEDAAEVPGEIPGETEAGAGNDADPAL